MRLVRAVVPCCAALFAALLAHVAIDVAGDALLAHDSYDDVAHGSRAIVVALTTLLALLASAASLARLVRAARGSERAFCTALRRAAPRAFAPFAAAVVAATLAALACMEALDLALAHARPNDAADLFGGSVPLGAGIAVLCALAAAAVARACLAKLGALETLVLAITAFVLRAAAALAAPPSARHARRWIAAVRLVALRRVAGRAPPAPRLALPAH